MAHARAAGDARRLAAVLAISGGVFLLELVGGILTNSLALLADSGHVFADLGGIALALFAVWLAAKPPSGRRTFGLYRVEILAAATNAVFLLGVAGFVLVQAWRRFSEEPQILTGPMLAIAALALVANLVAAAILRARAHASLNLRGAYFEVLSDALGSLTVLAAALVILTTGLRAADALASAFIGLLIVPRTWHLLREAVDVLLEATPRGMDLGAVRRRILAAPRVRDVHDLHAWTITSGMPVLSAHVVLEEPSDAGAVLDGLAACLRDEFDLEHSTFQLETSDRRRLERVTHA